MDGTGNESGKSAGESAGGTAEAADLAARLAAVVGQRGASVAAAESVTADSLAVELAAAENASTWFRGSVVAYAPEAKFSLLGVDRGPVITAGVAGQMAAGAARLLTADFAVGSTGVGGPEPAEGRPPGTVFIAVAGPAGCRVREYSFDGDPSGVVRQATTQALRDLLDCSEQWARTQRQ